MITSRYLQTILCLGALANAQELAVENGSFESPQAVESTIVDRWHESRAENLVGGYVMTKSRPGDTPDTAYGNQWLELIGQPNQMGDVYQRIGGWMPDRYCTVSFLLGNRLILSDSSLSVELWAGGDAAKAKSGKSPSEIGARLLATASNIPILPNGATEEITRSLATGKDGQAGEPLWLRLVQSGQLQKNSVVLIDNVSAKWTEHSLEPPPKKTAYSVRDITVPDGIVVEAGGVCYWPDGSLVVATRRGDIWTVREGRWNLFATGLMDPLGIWADTTGEAYVTQSSELTRIRDTDGDLTADRYETVTADWAVPGSKTDFVYGLCRDGDGNFYGTMHTTHAPWSREAKAPGKKYSFGGPMGAPVIGRGWSFQVDPKGKLTWWSSGLRAPNGLGFNAEGDLFATDNQGDWVGTSALHHIEQGDFHGHPSSYQWDPRRTVDLNLPLDQLAVELGKIRKRPAVLFPHGILGNSPSQPVLAPADGKFGPFAGQFFIGDNVAPLISRVCLEKVDGEYQGACFPFIREQGLRKALCRMTFSPDGKLVIAYGCRGWGPATQGLQEVAWSGEAPFEMQKIQLCSDGFKITFTKPLAEQDLSKAVSIQSYFYKYHHTYGSPIMDRKQVDCVETSLSLDRKVLKIRTSALEAGRIHEFRLNSVTASDGTVLANNEAYYTLNRLRTEEQSEWPIFPLCMDTHDAAKRSLEEQARLFRELGYDGCGHLCQDLGYGNISYPPNTTIEQRSETLAAEGLRIVQAYGRVYLERDVPINIERIREMMPTLAKNHTQLVLLLIGNRKADLDAKAVELLGKIADIAKPHGVSIALYPHATDYTETVGEALRIVKKLNRPDEVGVMFTFQHWKARDPNRDLRAVLTKAAPWLMSVSISGTNREGAATLPLGQGDYDVSEVLEILRNLNFNGPVGVMCWGMRGDARDHLEASMKQWRKWTSPAKLQMNGNVCEFETEDLKGQIGEGRFIGVNQLVYKPTGTKISGDGIANRHGLLSLYRVFTRNHRYGNAAYDWPEREISVDGSSVLMHWPATEARPFELQARYSFPEADRVNLAVTVKAREELVNFEVQVGSYFDEGFPKAGVWTEKGKPASSPSELGMWHAFPRDERAISIIGDGRWGHGPSPVDFTMREPFTVPLSIRRHAGDGLAAILNTSPDDCFAIYTAHDGEAHFSNYNALFGRTIPAGGSATAGVSITLGDWTDDSIMEKYGTKR
jgi:sugar phosphate isomerase/epimerase/glucose/arabinose dehydrogenase